MSHLVFPSSPRILTSTWAIRGSESKSFTLGTSIATYPGSRPARYAISSSNSLLSARLLAAFASLSTCSWVISSFLLLRQTFRRFLYLSLVTISLENPPTLSNSAHISASTLLWRSKESGRLSPARSTALESITSVTLVTLWK